jgi:hypothetical protein
VDDTVDGAAEELPHRDDHATEQQQKYRHLYRNTVYTLKKKHRLCLRTELKLGLM